METVRENERSTLICVVLTLHKGKKKSTNFLESLNKLQLKHATCFSLCEKRIFQ